MNNMESKRDDDMDEIGIEADYAAQITRNKAREMELEKQLRELDERKEQPFHAASLKYNAMAKIPDNSMNIMLAWLEEKDKENQRLKDQVQQLQTALHQKDIKLAIMREQLLNQEKIIEKEIMMRRSTLKEGTVKDEQEVHSAAWEHKSWDQDDKSNSKSLKSSTSTASLNSKSENESSNLKVTTVTIDAAINSPPYSNLKDRCFEGEQDVYKQYQTAQNRSIISPRENEDRENVSHDSRSSSANSSEVKDQFDEKASALKFQCNIVPQYQGKFVTYTAQDHSTSEFLKRDIFIRSTDGHEDELSSVGNSAGSLSIASSTAHDARKVVKDFRLIDPYGDTGKYSGKILESTGMPHGVGRMEYDRKGYTYDGNWNHGRWSGYGKATFQNGDTYEGEYQRDQRHGSGKYVWSDGRIYDGEFQDDQLHGMGKMVWPNGTTYIGEFRNFKKEGKGRHTYIGGGYYDGNWKNDIFAGFGERRWNDGRTYRGEWRLGKAHGEGFETLLDGQICNDGVWIEGKPVQNVRF